VSKRHQSNRRKSYGRRQHEVAERRASDQLPDALDHPLDDVAQGAIAERIAFFDSHAPRLRYALGD